MKTAILLLAAFGTNAVPAPGPRVSVESTLVLKVGDRDQVADAIIAEVERLGGYFTSRTDDALRLRVPREQSRPVLRFIEPLGVVVDRSYSATDRGAELAEKRARLASRKEVLERYFEVLAGATAANVVQVEAEMSKLIAEIEELEGSLRYLEHQLAYAELVIQFQFKDRRPPARDGSSSFAWLNNLNLVDLMEDFAHAW